MADPTPIPVPPPPAAMPGTPFTVSPAMADATGGELIQVTAEGAPGTVTWSITPDPPGIFHDGLYVAPRDLTVESLHTVTASAGQHTATANLHLVPITVRIT